MIQQQLCIDISTKKPNLNVLSGKEWLKYLISIWNDVHKTSEERNINHPAIFPLKLAERLIRIYAKSSNEIILDSFMGSGTTLSAAKKLSRKGIGFEISEEYIDLAESGCKYFHCK